MAFTFTEAQLNAVIDPANTGRVVTLETMVSGPLVTDCYCIGVLAPYAGRSRWIQITNSATPAQAWAAMQASLA